MGPPGGPVVTGISPKEGPPGTRVTIRGENLGSDARDFTGLKICGVDCYLTAEWISPSKIVARTGQGKGYGDVVVSTRAGGQGSSLVTFRGYFVTATGPVQESAVWVDESMTVRSPFDRERPSQSRQQPLLLMENLLGLSEETSGKKHTFAELQALFPEASGDLTLDNFDPAWYLLENHSDTCFDDLKAGLIYLNRNSRNHADEPTAFVKTNLYTFMEGQDALEAMYQKFTEDQRSGSLDMTKLEQVLVDANGDANTLFHDILSRKDKADSTRNGLSVLNRFRFLFYLPCTMQSNIQKGDYDVVINDYTRVKLLFKDTEVQVFKKVYSEVEKQIDAFRRSLYNKLLEMPAPHDEKKKLIRHLADLEYPGSPAWECITKQQQWLLKLLRDCKDEYVSKEKEETDSMLGRQRQRAGSMTAAMLALYAISEKDQAAVHLAGGAEGPKFKVPHKVQFVEDLSRNLISYFPDFWRLGQTYFSGMLLNKERDDKGKAANVDAQNNIKFKQMTTEVLSLYSNLVRAAFLPHTLENVDKVKLLEYGSWVLTKSDLPNAWLPQCVRSQRNCADALCGLDLPKEPFEFIKDLAFDMRTDTMVTILKQAVSEIAGLHLRETWTIETNDELGSTSQLPVLFENIVNDSIQHLHEVVMKLKPGEEEIFNDREVQKDATQLCISLVKAFADSLARLAFEPTLLSTKDGARDVGKPSSTTLSAEDSVFADRRLMITMSNCHHVLARVIPRVIENLEKHGYPETNKVLECAKNVFGDLDKRLFSAYTERKADAIVNALESRMYAGNFEWSTCREPSDVRSYIKETILDVTEVHAEVFSLSSAFVRRVLTAVMDSVSEELSRLILTTPKMNKSGVLQARADLFCFQKAASSYLSETARLRLKETVEMLPSQGSREDQKTLEKISARFVANMSFYMTSFQSAP